MRRIVLLSLGILELSAASALLYLGLALPSPDQVGQGFDRVEKTTRKASKQVATVRRQVVEVRRPEIQQLAERLRIQTETVSRTVNSQQVDFKTIVGLRDSLQTVSTELNRASQSLEPSRIGDLGKGLGETAKYIDEKLVPASTKAADQFDQLAGDLAKDAQQLAKVLREVPPDLRAAREVYDSLGRFDEGLEKMLKVIEFKRLDAIKEGFAGLETSLEATAGEVEKIAGYKYPNIKVRGLRIEMEEKPFWPNGDRIAEGLRKATTGVRAAQKEIETVGKELPGIRISLEESRKVVAKTRETLGQTLKQQDKLDALLRDVPDRIARLAESLPKLTAELAKILRETQHMKELAKGLRLVQESLDSAVAKWPAVKLALDHTAKILKVSADRLDHVVTNRAEYETSVKQSTELADTFARMVPLISDQLSMQLGEQEKSLTDLEASLDEAGAAVPEFKNSATDVLRAGKLLIWLVTIAVGLHGAFLLADNWKHSSPRRA